LFEVSSRFEVPVNEFLSVFKIPVTEVLSVFKIPVISRKIRDLIEFWKPFLPSRLVWTVHSHLRSSHYHFFEIVFVTLPVRATRTALWRETGAWLGTKRSVHAHRTGGAKWPAGLLAWQFRFLSMAALWNH
jgi:hypothetical protein